LVPLPTKIVPSVSISDIDWFLWVMIALMPFSPPRLHGQSQPPMHLLVVSEGGSLRFRRSYSLAAATRAITKRIILFLPLTSRSLIECENCASAA
jgi:hypothetical protein